MTRMPFNQPPVPPPPPPPEPEYRFRWAIFLGIPVVTLIFLYVLHGIEPSFVFADIMETFDVVNDSAYVRLGCLAVVLAAITFVVKFLRRNRDE